MDKSKRQQLTNKSVGRKECGGDYLDELHCYLGARVLFHFEMSSYYWGVRCVDCMQSKHSQTPNQQYQFRCVAGYVKWMLLEDGRVSWWCVSHFSGAFWEKGPVVVTIMSTCRDENRITRKRMPREWNFFGMLLRFCSITFSAAWGGRWTQWMRKARTVRFKGSSGGPRTKTKMMMQRATVRNVAMQ